MAWMESQLVESAIDMVVFECATHGDHAGKLSVLLTTKTSEVYGRGMNTVITTSHFNTNYPMQEGKMEHFPRWVKVEKLCKLSIQKIVVGCGWGAAVTKTNDLLMWGTGATTYLSNQGIEFLQLHDHQEKCTFCKGSCSHGRRIGNTYFSYCKEKQTLVTHSPPPPRNVAVKKVGNRRFGPFMCSACLTECNMEVIENHCFNFCNNCNQLWDLDENAMPMNVKTTTTESFLRVLDYPGKIRDVAPFRWGFWVLADFNRVLFSAFFMRSDPMDKPLWWKHPIGVSNMENNPKLMSIHCSKSDVFVVTDTRLLYKRTTSSKSNREMHTLRRVNLVAGVKKIFCGRLASLCLLEDGTVWLLYGPRSRDDAEAGAEEILSGRGSQGSLDVSGISYGDLFYVQTYQYQGNVTKKHPLLGNLIKVVFGQTDCKTFFWNFSHRCRVSEGKISYDEGTLTQLISSTPKLPQTQVEIFREDPSDADVSEPLSIQVATGTTAVSVGLGFPVGVTSWSTWWALLARWASSVWTFGSNTAQWMHQGVLKTFKRNPHHLSGVTPSMDSITAHHSLPPFQSGLYGKPQFSDFSLHLSDGTFPGHRIILCTTSKYFKTKLGGSKFEVKSWDAKKCNPRAYRCLLKHFYQVQPDNLPLEDELDLLKLATNYEEHRIVREVEDKIIPKISVDNVMKIMDVATDCASKRIKQRCEHFMKDKKSLPH